MSNTYVFAIDVSKWGEDTVLKTIHFLASNLFEAAHIGTECVFESGEFDNVPIEVTNLYKVKGIGNIINAGEYSTEDSEVGEYDPKFPFEVVKNLPPERVMKFKCSCHEELKVGNIGWPYIICPNCENKIYRNEIEETGGIYLYVKRSEK